MALPVVAIVGRPNVGKSTLFNRIIRSRMAATDDRPGVTRDRLYEEAQVDDRRFILIDTGGIEFDTGRELAEAITRQVHIAIQEADAIIFLVDGRAGVVPADEEIADVLRRTAKPIVLAVNKIDGDKHDLLEADFWQLGIRPLQGISAAHGRGVYDMLMAVLEGLPVEEGVDVASADDEDGDDDDDSAAVDDGFDDDPLDEDLDAELDEEAELQSVKPQAEAPRPLRVAIIGRPNVGKSTLVNRLVGAERQVVSDVAGTTTDPVDTHLEVDGKTYVIVDTAGVRRKGLIDDPLERFVSLRAIRSIERCHVCILLIDGTVGPTHQEATLAQLIEDRGRGLVILINKWDVAKELEDVDRRSIEDTLEERFAHVRWAPHLFISAKTGKGTHMILPLIEEVYAAMNRRIPTPELNRVLERILRVNTVPQRHHRAVRIYFGVQRRVRPPTFTFFSNTPEGVVVSWQRYLVNFLRKEYDFKGTPLRIKYRKRRKPGQPVNP
jgi:GTP-binding protein